MDPWLLKFFDVQVTILSWSFGSIVGRSRKSLSEPGSCAFALYALIPHTRTQQGKHKNKTKQKRSADTLYVDSEALEVVRVGEVGVRQINQGRLLGRRNSDTVFSLVVLDLSWGK